MDFTLEAATKALLYATEGSRPSLARYPPNKYRKIYAVSGHELKGKAAKLNTDLALALATKDTARDLAFALTNVKAMRREAILSHLPPVFKSATKVDLMKSAIDSAVLFDEDRVKETLRVADKTASISFQQAAARVLVKPRPATGTPLVECGSRSNTAVATSYHRFSVSSRRPDSSSNLRAPQSQKHTAGFSNTTRSKRIAKGAIEEAPATPGFYSHLFVVTKATGGFRPVLDLSSLNRYVTTTQFRMETSMIYLGMEIRSPLMKVFPTQWRIEKRHHQIQLFLSVQSPTTKVHSSSSRGETKGATLTILVVPVVEPTVLSRRLSNSLGQRNSRGSLVVASDHNLRVGQSLQLAHSDVCLYTDASNLGWGASVLHDSVSGLWTPHKRSLHINLLELRAVRLGLLHFREQVHGKTVAVFSDNTTALSYLAKEGGTRSGSLNAEAQTILQWAEDHAIQIVTQFVKGSSNVLADCLSRQDQIISTEWMLHQDICSQLWRLWSYPTVDLFATRLNFRLSNLVSPFWDPMAIATDAFLYNWDHQDLYASHPFPLVRKVINKLRAASCINLVLIAPFWPQKEWFPDLVQASVDFPRLLPHRRDLLLQPHVRRFHQALPMLQLAAWRLSSEFSVTEAIPPELRNSWRVLNVIPPL
ncbi:hypothetical protein Pcinc_029750 [Petrolisthes cinctipes]|uniref:Uncharacterized protein n=2 Tax=Petrolisthes cinctipes TaxID=88211 RepID=A0AAE1EZN8_PETCI|nr:hypothetical protein Pcinc_029750 [Petrolisthes cinctipes]